MRIRYKRRKNGKSLKSWTIYVDGKWAGVMLRAESDAAVSVELHGKRLFVGYDSLRGAKRAVRDYVNLLDFLGCWA
jgi:hypothetical protein